jgi:hypothetical protein
MKQAVVLVDPVTSGTHLKLAAKLSITHNFYLTIVRFLHLLFRA